MNTEISKPFKHVSKNFIRCGVLGWCLEILFTSLTSSHATNRSLMGKTSIFMFPIYGAACLFGPLYPYIKKLAWPFRGLLYMNLIYLGEYLSGILLMKFNCCPWDYSAARYNYKSVIRLDFAPFWFCTGLLYERFLRSNK